ncbi:head-tail adaptor Ad1 [Mycobacterium phage Mutaforma13]|uniref:Head-to-tail adaptor n=1 Tax=Mycobacterium phage Mutaforma13 TaxID=2922219 RepID=G1DU95_9CAUD|nr:head-tail adaptor Ad1 [Mycobacterium phage Mutaforma13]AEJ93094.1 head-to-tail adaptor [Mycobacterium phage Mutaforma13]
MLATADDVAAALGLASAADLTPEQQARVDALLERVSDAFQRVSGRVFTTGITRVRANVVNGRVWLPGLVEEVNSVENVDGSDVDFTQDGNYVDVSRNGCPLVTGTVVVVEYVGGGAPDAVTSLVAAVVARHLTVQPGSVQAQAVALTAGPFTQRNAEWVSSTSLFTPDELDDVRRFAHPVPTITVHRL